MKTDNTQNKLNIRDEKKQCLLDMIEIYCKEEDVEKRLILQKFIHEYILANNSLVHEILNCKDSQRASKIERYFWRENRDLNYEISKYKITLDRLAVVSVKSNLWENLSTYTESEMKRLYKGYSADVSREFNLEDIWEFAVLSKDKKSFVLVRDFLDKKIQPISNCVFWGGMTVKELIERDHSFKREIYTISFFPKSMLEVPQEGINTFTDKNLHNGILLEDLYTKNYNSTKNQMHNVMEQRVKQYEQDLSEKEEQEKYNSRQTLEF